MDKAPVIGNNTIGKREVAGMGMASVIHHTAIHKVLPRIATPSRDKPFG